MTDPPVEYDEKGTTKKSYTKAELDELKGADKTLPGYTGEYDNLAKGQTVIVYLSRKLPPKSSDTPTSKPADDKAGVKPAVPLDPRNLSSAAKPAVGKAGAEPPVDPAGVKPADNKAKGKDSDTTAAKADTRNGCSSAGLAARCKTSLVPTRVPPRARMRRRV